MNFSNLAIFLTPTNDVAQAGGAGPLDILYSMFPLLLIFGVFYLLLIRPQSKRRKVEKEMRDNIQIADEVVTVGGIIGRVLSVKDDTVLIETGGDRTRIRVLRTAIAENKTIHDTKA